MKSLYVAILASIASITIALPGLADVGTIVTRSPYSRVNVRSGPGTSYDVAFQLRPGVQVNIAEQQQVGDHTWYRVGWQFGGDGWIRGDLIQPIDIRGDRFTCTPQIDGAPQETDINRSEAARLSTLRQNERPIYLCRGTNILTTDILHERAIAFAVNYLSDRYPSRGFRIVRVEPQPDRHQVIAIAADDLTGYILDVNLTSETILSETLFDP